MAGVEVSHVQRAVADQEVVRDEDAGHGGEEDGPARQHSDEGRRLRHEIPRARRDADDGDDVAAAADVDVARTQGCNVHAASNGVCDDAEGERGSEEAEAGEEGAGARGRRHGGLLDHEEELEGVPEDLAIQLGGGGGDEEAEERGEDDAEGSSNDLAEEGGVWVFGVTGPVWWVLGLVEVEVGKWGVWGRTGLT